MPKRKSNAIEERAEVTPRRSMRRKSGADAPVASPAPAKTRAVKTDAKSTRGEKTASKTEEAKRGRKSTEPKDEPVKANEGEHEEEEAQKPESEPEPKAKKRRTTSRASKSANAKPDSKAAPPKTSTTKAKKAAPNGTSSSAPSSDRQYWLMKAEPETRLENGVDVRFSIDDLAARTEPEPWDGIRNYVARNNLRAMKKGDLAFFYHSNCREPGIVGVMEIVREHSPDLSARDPKCPYYDPKDTKEDEHKWSVVHVEFRRKFETPIGLRELKEMSEVSEMQVLKQSRLSVSRVRKEEWEFLMAVVEGREKAK